MKTRVFNLIILDESGSMSCIERQALTGVNETLQTIRRAQEKYPEQEQYVTFVPFQTGSIKFVRDCEPIANVKDLEPKDYNPGTCTPLYDAIGLSVNHLKKNVAETDSVLVRRRDEVQRLALHLHRSQSRCHRSGKDHEHQECHELCSGRSRHP